ncbi:MAG: NAD(P)-dependent glycerol-3-phosphate dehydrogenase [Nitrospirae bacterium]|nr:NAD(P)-dependent glycerol-3-phosphate dehydrogenase [Nitrospirota bacterium]MBI3594401.1 NAD(P)-dependent glycerol-3-phosphate dehydrogenase [Nitrospirota bacterium]
MQFPKQLKTISIIGAGSWGTGLAALLSEKSFNIRLWAFEEETVQSIHDLRENKIYLPGVPLSSSIQVTSSMEEALENSDLVLFVVPSHAARSVLVKIARFIKPGTPVLSATKGIENKTLLLPTQIMREILPKKCQSYIGALSGPTFAKEIILKQPTAAVLAIHDSRLAIFLQTHLTTSSFIIYVSKDILGVQIGGALKNVIAIATGCSDGLGFGDNSRAALITRGLSEIIRLGVAMGAKKETFAGLSGIGDLILTATSHQSRNYSVGYQVGKGSAVREIIGGSKSVAEGVRTTLAAYHLAKRFKIKTPIIEQLYLILYKNKEPRKAVDELIYRAAHSKKEKLEF